MSNKFLKRPNAALDPKKEARFNCYGLRDNPFPSEPFVNRNSSDSRVNGDIYDATLRLDEHSKLTNSFFVPERREASHLKLGYIEDTSYLGRGNGKSAFILNACEAINEGYCLEQSKGANRCFSLILNPRPGGKTKTFEAFVDLLLTAIHESDFIEIAIGSLVLEALATTHEYEEALNEITDEASLKACVYSHEWHERHNIDRSMISEYLSSNSFLSQIDPSSPLGDVAKKASLFGDFVSSDDCVAYYQTELRKGQARLDFVFNDLTLLFLAAGFNGAFVFVDDFERIPDFQSARQKKDFATELRSILFDGPYASSTYGFYSLLLVLHAGVPRLIGDAWQSSGLSSRSPIGDQSENHVIPFEKLGASKIESLVSRYLNEFRTADATSTGLDPFTKEAIGLVAEFCEFNAGRILSTCHGLLDKAAEEGAPSLDKAFIKSKLDVESSEDASNELKGQLSTEVDLLQKSRDSKD